MGRPGYEVNTRICIYMQLKEEEWTFSNMAWRMRIDSPSRLVFRTCVSSVYGHWPLLDLLFSSVYCEQLDHSSTCVCEIVEASAWYVCRDVEAKLSHLLAFVECAVERQRTQCLPEQHVLTVSVFVENEKNCVSFISPLKWYAKSLGMWHNNNI